MEWIKSSFCKADSPMCVEVADGPLGVDVRDSKRPDVVLHVIHEDWAAFITGVKAGEFDA